MTDTALRRVLADRRRIELLAAEQRRELLGIDDVVDVLLGAAERDEVEPAGRADELADRVGIGDARQLDDDAVGALGRDDRLRHAGRVDAALDDLADDLEVLGPRDLVADLLRLVFDPEAALEVEAQLRLERALAIGGRRIRDSKPGTKTTMSAAMPMTMMRMGPALRIGRG